MVTEPIKPNDIRCITCYFFKAGLCSHPDIIKLNLHQYQQRRVQGAGCVVWKWKFEKTKPIPVVENFI